MVTVLSYKVFIFLPVQIFTLCNSAYHTSIIESKRIRISFPCRNDLDCKENEFCSSVSQTCDCKQGYYPEYNHSVCLEVATSMGDSCISHYKCRASFGAEAECRENVCQCSEGADFREGLCRKLVGLRKYCRTSSYCYVEKSYCYEGFCHCTLNHHPNSDLTKCLIDAKLGGNCTIDEECVCDSSTIKKDHDEKKHLRCSKSKCVCTLGHVPSEDETRCLMVANSVGDFCEEDQQCTEYITNSTCKNNTCTCSKNFHRRGSLCMKNVALNQPCRNHQECITPTNKDSNSTEIRNVGCYNGVCACAPNYILTNDFCDCIGFSELNGTTKSSTNLNLLLIFVFITASISI